MRHLLRAIVAMAIVFAALTSVQDDRTTIRASALPQQGSGSDWYLNIAAAGRAVRMAIPDFEVVTASASQQAQTISSVVWDDMEFASLYRLVPKRNYGIAQANQPGRGIDFLQWEAIRTDILIKGVVEIRQDTLISEVRIYAIQAQEMVFGKRYEGPVNAARRMAHRIADDILIQAGGYLGVNRTRLAFTSDRRGERTKEIYVMDYDGFGQKPLTANRSLNLTPTWAPDGRSLGYISYRTGTPSLHVAHIYEGRGELLDTGGGMALNPAWSPDGRRIAFTSTRDGNSEIYLVNADGSGLQRLTHHPSIDTSPAWSPTGRELAFTSDRTGAPQIYAMDTDGLNLRRVSYQGSYNDSPSWSPSRQYSELAFASRIERGPFDIVVYNFETNQTRQLTTGRGTNEDPDWSPNGLHLVFTSSRNGSDQIWTMNRDGSNQRRLTGEGNNKTPRWGPIPGGES